MIGKRVKHYRIGEKQEICFEGVIMAVISKGESAVLIIKKMDLKKKQFTDVNRRGDRYLIVGDNGNFILPMVHVLLSEVK